MAKNTLTGKRLALRGDAEVATLGGRRKGVTLPLYGEPTDDSDPAEVLLQEIRRTAGHIQWLGGQIKLSDPEMFVKSMWLHARTSGWVAPGELDQNDWSAAGALWVELYLKERTHLASICRTALAAGIEERRVRMAERMAERIGDAVSGIMYDLGEAGYVRNGEPLDPEHPLVRAIIYKWLSEAQGISQIDPRLGRNATYFHPLGKD